MSAGFDIVSFKEIANKFDAVFLDSFGVLKTYTGLIPGVQECIDFLREEDIPLRVLTNDASRSLLEQEEVFTRMGLKGITSNEIITSGTLTKQYLSNKFDSGLVAYLGTENAADYVIDSPLEKIPITAVNDDNRDSVRAMIFLDDEGFDWQRDINLCLNLLRHKNIPAIVANSDRIYPLTQKDVAIATGAIAQLIEHVLGRKFIQFGKPDSLMFTYAYEQVNENRRIHRNRILMVGDTLHTDILGGNKFGTATALVLSGNTSYKNAQMLIRSRGIRPDYICESIAT